MNKKTSLNPFSLGGPIGAPTRFIGRELIVGKLVNAMIRLQNISLLGERRTGKTSLLLYLSNPDSPFLIGLPTQHIPVYVDFQPFTQSTEDEVIQSISEAIIIAVRERLKDETEILNDITTEISVLDELPSPTNLRRLLRKLFVHEYRVHLLFDEFEQISDNEYIQRSFYSFLRSLATGQNSSVSYIIASRKPLSEIEPAMTGSAFFNIFATESLSLFGEKEAYQLILDAFSRSNIENKKEKIRLLRENLRILYDLTGFHPFFLQALCYRLFNHVDLPGWPSGAALVRVIDEYIQDVEPVLGDYWNLSSKAEQELLEKLARHEASYWGGVESVTTRDTLQRRGLILPTDDIEDTWMPFSAIFTEWIKGQYQLSSAFADKYVYKRAGGSIRSEKILHVFTGSKGGVGKTLLALCAAIKSSEKEKVLCIDLNWENPDLSRILESIQQTDHKSQKMDYQHAFIENILLLRPPVRHILPSGAIGFWQSVRNALRESFDVHGFDPAHIIVDTNMHFASLLRLRSLDTQSRVSTRINDLVREAQIRHLYIWYSWTLTSLNERSEDPANMLRALSWFDSTLDNYFFTHENLIHVLNLFALFPSYYSRTAKTVEIKSFQALSDANTGKGLDLKDLVETANTLLRDVNNLSHPEERQNLIDELGTRLFNQSDQKRPWNLFPIPISPDPSVAGFTDSIMLEKPNSIEEIRKLVAPIYKYVSSYLDALQQR